MLQWILERSPRFQLSGLLLIVLLVGLLFPIATGPLIGTLTVVSQFDFVEGLGALIAIGLPVAGGALLYFNQQRYLCLIGAAFIFVLMRFAWRFEDIKATANASAQGNMFGGVLTAAMGLYHLQWGLYVLLIASSLLVFVAFMRDAEGPSFKALVQANRALFLDAAALFIVLALALGLYPVVFHHPSSDAAASSMSTPSTSDGASDTPTEAPEDSKVAQIRQAVSVGLLQKGFHEADASNYEFQSYFTGQVQYHNLSHETITGIKGALEFYDQFGSEIKGFKIQYETPLRPGAEAEEWNQWDYNQFMNEDNQLKSTPLSRLTVKWVPEAVNFADGTKLTSD